LKRHPAVVPGGKAEAHWNQTILIHQKRQLPYQTIRMGFNFAKRFLYAAISA
jgi:hypothetical protein